MKERGWLTNRIIFNLRRITILITISIPNLNLHDQSSSLIILHHKISLGYNMIRLIINIEWLSHSINMVKLITTIPYWVTQDTFRRYVVCTLKASWQKVSWGIQVDSVLGEILSILLWKESYPLIDRNWFIPLKINIPPDI
jgi:hypothetical protein